MDTRAVLTSASTVTLYAVYAMIGDTLKWYDFYTSSWAAFPVHTADQSRAKSVVAVFNAVNAVAVVTEIQGGNTRYLY